MEYLLDASGIARSTFYYHSKKLKEDDENCSIAEEILKIYHEHKGRYGYRRITMELRNLGHLINHKKVQRLMQSMHLKSLVRPKKYRSYRGEEGRIATNVLKRDFNSNQPNEKWVTDVTEFNVAGEKLYLSPIMDLYNTEIITYQLHKRPVLRMVTTMINNAIKSLLSAEKPIVHSDQGWQYQNRQYQSILKSKGLIQSMSRKGNCLDNAVMESFFGTLKTELYYLQKWESADQLKSAIEEYIYYYNHKRIKQKLKGLSPIQYRTQALAA